MSALSLLGVNISKIQVITVDLDLNVQLLYIQRCRHAFRYVYVSVDSLMSLIHPFACCAVYLRQYYDELAITTSLEKYGSGSETWPVKVEHELKMNEYDQMDVWG